MKRATIVWLVVVALAFAGGLWCGKMCGGGRSRGWGMWSAGGHEQMVDRFSRKLKLTVQQREQVSAILEQRRAQMRALHYQVRPQFESMRAQTSDQIRAVLTPEQITAFDKMEAEQDKRWQKIRAKYDSADEAKAK
jgi:Spy/CpxP family protein refolding chaperone